MLRRFFHLQKEIKQFMEEKGKPMLEFFSGEWMQDLASMVDFTEHLNTLNKQWKAVTTLSHNIMTAYALLSCSGHCGRSNSPVVM